MECEYCKGCGGFDASRDIEVYDEWVECDNCDGTGEVDVDVDSDCSDCVICL